MSRRGSEYSDDQSFVIMGEIGAIHHPFNLTEEEAERYAAELAEKEKRRRPIGFTASWPDDLPHLQIVADT